MIENLHEGDVILAVDKNEPKNLLIDAFKDFKQRGKSAIAGGSRSLNSVSNSKLNAIGMKSMQYFKDNVDQNGPRK